MELEMAMGDRIKSTAEEAAAKAKQAAGRADDSDLEADGHADEAPAEPQKTGQNIEYAIDSE